MKIIIRIIVDLFIFGLIFIAPWWLSVAVIAAAIFVFQKFFEALFFAVLLDGYHGVTGLTFFELNIFFTSIMSAVLLLSIFLKNRLTFY